MKKFLLLVLFLSVTCAWASLSLVQQGRAARGSGNLIEAVAYFRAAMTGDQRAVASTELRELAGQLRQQAGAETLAAEIELFLRSEEDSTLQNLPSRSSSEATSLLDSAVRGHVRAPTLDVQLTESQQMWRGFLSAATAGILANAVSGVTGEANRDLLLSQATQALSQASPELEFARDMTNLLNQSRSASPPPASASATGQNTASRASTRQIQDSRPTTFSVPQQQPASSSQPNLVEAASSGATPPSCNFGGGIEGRRASDRCRCVGKHVYFQDRLSKGWTCMSRNNRSPLWGCDIMDGNRLSCSQR